MRLIISKGIKQTYDIISGSRLYLTLGDAYMNVARIVDDVKSNGDLAIRRYTTEFDGFDLRDFHLGERKLRRMAARADKRFINAFRVIVERQRTVYSTYLSMLKTDLTSNLGGVELVSRFEPIETVGIYVPRGKRPYVSTLVMAALPAALVGVKRILVSTPPTNVHSLANFAYACVELGVCDVYLVGGAQGVAALAYGTESVPRVDKIVGPGGPIVTMAKHYVSKDVSIDFLAGPTELLTIADDSADERVIALDLISQAEHGKEAWIGFITDSKRLSKAVIERVGDAIRECPAARASLEGSGYVVLVSSIDEAIGLAEMIAPEHLQLLGPRVEGKAGLIKRAGVILVGRDAPPSATDYFLGPNHILPTLGIASARGCLNPMDFVKLRIEVSNCEGFKEGLLRSMATFAREEEFRCHAKALRMRSRG